MNILIKLTKSFIPIIISTINNVILIFEVYYYWYFYLENKRNSRVAISYENFSSFKTKPPVNEHISYKRYIFY